MVKALVKRSRPFEPPLTRRRAVARSLAARARRMEDSRLARKQASSWAAMAGSHARPGLAMRGWSMAWA
jgi:hypothetical protein